MYSQRAAAAKFRSRASASESGWPASWLALARPGPVSAAGPPSWSGGRAEAVPDRGGVAGVCGGAVLGLGQDEHLVVFHRFVAFVDDGGDAGCPGGVLAGDLPVFEHGERGVFDGADVDGG